MSRLVMTWKRKLFIEANLTMTFNYKANTNLQKMQYFVGRRENKDFYLQDCEIFKYTVHHVTLRQVLELPDEVDHVFTHWTAVDLVKVSSSLISRMLCLHLLHNLFAKTADFRGYLDDHVLSALIPDN